LKQYDRNLRNAWQFLRVKYFNIIPEQVARAQCSVKSKWE